jgi:uncharacterized protein
MVLVRYASRTAKRIGGHGWATRSLLRAIILSTQPDGLGVAQDYAEALKWYLRAADQGDANAQFRLGTMYEQGHGVPQDYILAHMHYDLAAALQDGYKHPVNKRDNLEGRMTPEQIAEAQKLAREWKPKPER